MFWSLGCNEYKVLGTADRSVHHTYTPEAECDYNLPPAWYRFQGKAGNSMASKCPKQFRCGTIVPGWLEGKDPSVKDGIVSRKVCFHQNRNCCYASVAAKVRNCGGFFVYKLPSAPYCQIRYCGNGNLVSGEVNNHFVFCSLLVVIMPWIIPIPYAPWKFLSWNKRNDYLFIYPKNSGHFFYI